MLDLVDAFVSGRGKFAIPGYPAKLGFLLWGPPGTGKTSFIKALATLTGRSIVSIPLARIRTNTELFDLLMDQVADVEGHDMPVALPFSKVRPAVGCTVRGAAGAAGAATFRCFFLCFNLCGTSFAEPPLKILPTQPARPAAAATTTSRAVHLHL